MIVVERGERRSVTASGDGPRAKAREQAGLAGHTQTKEVEENYSAGGGKEAMVEDETDPYAHAKKPTRAYGHWWQRGRGSLGGLEAVGCCALLCHGRARIDIPATIRPGNQHCSTLRPRKNTAPEPA